jgi:hypothetical protein
VFSQHLSIAFHEVFVLHGGRIAELHPDAFPTAFDPQDVGIEVIGGYVKEMPISGFMRSAATAAPRQPISSCTVKT